MLIVDKSTSSKQKRAYVVHVERTTQGSVHLVRDSNKSQPQILFVYKLLNAILVYVYINVKVLVHFFIFHHVTCTSSEFESLKYIYYDCSLHESCYMFNRCTSSLFETFIVFAYMSC